MKLKLNNINKSFGKVHVLHDVCFEVDSGRAMGFLGRNGSGKTTSIRCIMDIFKPDSGEILLDDQPFKPRELKVGYLPEERGMYAKEPIIEQLIYFGQLKGGTKQESKKSAEEWLERFELSEYATKNLEVLSKGNQQKIQIIQAFLNEPEMIILDEPFSGLDPVNAELFKDAIRDAIKKNKLVIFSSHQMGYVEEFCDDITLIDKGEILINGPLADVKAEMSHDKYRVEATNLNREQLKQVLRQIESDLNIEHDLLANEDKISLIIDLSNIVPNNFLQKIIAADVQIKNFSVYLPTLTDVFLHYVKDHDLQTNGTKANDSEKIQDAEHVAK
ncbi:MAG: ABC transporter ATP-binding protein [Clostridiaceae bacterium]|nr:ABC transporter ATP-binding protein [Clostridiaceae bacterium]